MDWKKIIDDMVERGETHTSIAAATGITSANIHWLSRRDTQSPRYKTAVKLLAMHKRLMRKYPKVDTLA